MYGAKDFMTSASTASTRFVEPLAKFIISSFLKQERIDEQLGQIAPGSKAKQSLNDGRLDMASDMDEDAEDDAVGAALVGSARRKRSSSVALRNLSAPPNLFTIKLEK